MNLKQCTLATALLGAAVICNTSTVWATSVPDGEYVVTSFWSDSSEAINDEQIHTSASQSNSSGSVSISAQDDFFAGDGTDAISRSADSWTNFGKSYQWVTPNNAPPAPYSYVRSISYSGNCVAAGGAQLQGSWSSSVQSGSLLPGGSANASFTQTVEGEGSEYISVEMSLSVSSSLTMIAHQNAVSGTLTQSLGGSIGEPVS